MYHYTYLIKQIKGRMKYIGVRTSACNPEQDTSYFGSSKHLPKDVKITHKKRILRVFASRKEAVLHEIYLHHKYNVHLNDEFYNRSKQTSTKFDTTGIPGPNLSLEARQKISLANKGRKRSRECVEQMRRRATGQKQSKETVQKRIASIAANNKNKGAKAATFKPWYMSTNTITFIFYNQSKNEKSVEDGHYPKYYADLQKKHNRIQQPVMTRQYGLVTLGFLTS
jgi:hypothetical protein